MRPLALVGLITLFALPLAGCGRTSPATPTEPTHVTSAAEVAEMTARFKEDEELRPVYKEEREVCEAAHDKDEYGKECIEPLSEKLAKLSVREEVLANELMHKVGEGCREALRTGSVFGRIEPQTIAGCKRDIGK
jgi:hypothetical protein